MLCFQNIFTTTNSPDHLWEAYQNDTPSRYNIASWALCLEIIVIVFSEPILLQLIGYAKTITTRHATTKVKVCDIIATCILAAAPKSLIFAVQTPTQTTHSYSDLYFQFQFLYQSRDRDYNLLSFYEHWLNYNGSVIYAPMYYKEVLIQTVVLRQFTHVWGNIIMWCMAICKNEDSQAQAYPPDFANLAIHFDCIPSSLSLYRECIVGDSCLTNSTYVLQESS